MTSRFISCDAIRNQMAEIIVLSCDVICNGMHNAIQVRLNKNYKIGCLHSFTQTDFGMGFWVPIGFMDYLFGNLV